MGVKGSKKFIDSYKKKVHISELQNKGITCIIVDMHNKAYQAGPRYMKFFEDLFMKLKNYKMTICGVFDGKSPIEKITIINKRKQRDVVYKDKLNKASSLREQERLERRLFKFDYEKQDILKVFMKEKSIHWVYAKEEADPVCGYMCNKLNAACISNDIDLLVFGVDTMIVKHYNNDYVDIICMQEIYNKLNIKRQQFVDACLLAGCDYLSNKFKIKLEEAIIMIKRYGSIENLINKKVISIEKPWNYIDSRNVYKCKDSKYNEIIKDKRSNLHHERIIKLLN